MRAPKAVRITLAGGLLACAALTGGKALAGVAHADTAAQLPLLNRGAEKNLIAMADLKAADIAPAAITAKSEPVFRVAQTLPRVSADQVLSLAGSQVGINENAQGGGTKFHSWYMDSPRATQTSTRDGGPVAAYRNAPWCDMFVSWVGAKLGIERTMGWDAYTVSHASWFKQNNRWGDHPAPGAVVFFGWKGTKNINDISHVGFVVADNGNGTIKTIEGNTGDGDVAYRTRPTDKVVGYGYPVYAPQTPTA